MPVIEKNLDRAELAHLVHTKTGVDVKTVQAVFSALFEKLTQGVALTSYAELDGLGSFKLVVRAAKSGKSPNGKEYSVPKRLAIIFHPFDDFRDTVERETGMKCI